MVQRRRLPRCAPTGAEKCRSGSCVGRRALRRETTSRDPSMGSSPCQRTPVGSNRAGRSVKSDAKQSPKKRRRTVAVENERREIVRGECGRPGSPRLCRGVCLAWRPLSCATRGGRRHVPPADVCKTRTGSPLSPDSHAEPHRRDAKCSSEHDGTSTPHQPSAEVHLQSGKEEKAKSSRGMLWRGNARAREAVSERCAGFCSGEVPSRSKSSTCESRLSVIRNEFEVTPNSQVGCRRAWRCPSVRMERPAQFASLVVTATSIRCIQ